MFLQKERVWLFTETDRSASAPSTRNVLDAGFEIEVCEANVLWTGKILEKMNKFFVLQIKKKKKIMLKGRCQGSNQSCC